MPISIHVNIKKINHLETSGDFSFQLGMGNKELGINVAPTYRRFIKHVLKLKYILGE